eukprot:TRINITY_DN28027_c0_g1_i1.p1 TRINITY_DN28027_c0_g1~~TRINITY_DN28027_c0_g1_i1.p1  ORF type:complete len:494 (+),score=50.85 TRINITY_DN28027_c0_g1_i1:55-1536(+)
MPVAAMYAKSTCVVLAGPALLALVLSGCGGGESKARLITTECNRSQARGQCSECRCLAKDGNCTGPVGCFACKAPYVYQRTSGPEAQVEDGECSISCPAPDAWPPMPKNILDLNGIAWPEACWNDTENHFFIIGDWGGVFGNPPVTFSNRKTSVPEIDPKAQLLVAGKMAEIAKNSKPKFVVNVGDNFYPGGIGGPGSCNAETGKTDATGTIVFNSVFENIYKGDGIDGVEWWGVLGNHDYGGYHYNVHWDQNVFYTWHAKNTRWLTPALYWSRKVQFRDFSVDFFFVDTNKVDAQPPDVDPNHNICSRLNNQAPPMQPQDLICNGTSMQSPATCYIFFDDLWKNQKKWLQEKLPASEAEWQIIVSHYPPTFEPCMSQAWKQYFGKYGVDLFISGHTHQQETHYQDKLFGDTAYVISGGGGGITSEIIPDIHGHDDAYGFMDAVITKDQIEIIRYSHGGIEKQTIVRGTTLVYPRLPSSTSDFESGLSDQIVF